MEDDLANLAAASATVPDGYVALFVVSILFSALFSGVETILTGHTQAKAKQMIDEHPRYRNMLRMWIEQPEYLLTVILVGNNLANVTASILVGRIFEALLPDAGVGWAISAMTMMLLIFGEITPKSLGHRYGNVLIFPVLRFLAVAQWLLFPIAKPLAWFIRLITGKVRGVERPSMEAQDIQYMIGLGQREKVLDSQRADILDSVFDLSGTVARQVMVPRTEMTVVSLDTELDEADRIVFESGHSRIPVYQENIDNILGILNAKDLLRHHSQEERKVFDIQKYIRPTGFIPENQPVLKLLKYFQSQRKHLAIVVDEYGGVSGLVTLEDVLEEIVGPIRDEYDTSELESMYQQVGENIYLVQAQMHLEELEDELEITLPSASGSDEYETLAGYVVSHFDRVPEVGQVIKLDDLRITVKKADPRKVIQVEIVKIQPDDDPPEKKNESE